MSEEALYELREEGTNGWFVVDNGSNLTKDKCYNLYQFLLSQGVNPQRLKIVRVALDTRITGTDPLTFG